MKSDAAIDGFESYFAELVGFLRDQISKHEDILNGRDFSRFFGVAVDRKEFEATLTELNKVFFISVTEKKSKRKDEKKPTVRKLYTINGCKTDRLKLALEILEGSPAIVEITWTGEEFAVSKTRLREFSLHSLLRYADFPLLPKQHIHSMSLAQLSCYLNTVASRLYLGMVYRKARELVDLEQG